VAVATGEGGQAALRYAWQFYQLPYGIFAVALATAIFPELAERANRGDMPAFTAMFARGMRTTMVLIVPLASLLAILATPIITLYRAGRFTAEDVPVVAGVLLWWAIGLAFFAGYMFVLKSFYSLQDTATPMYTNIVATTLHVVLYAGLTRGLGAWDGLGIIGIPIADGIFFFGHLIALLVILRRRVGPIEGKALALTFAKVAVGSAAGAGVAWGAMALTSGLAELPAGFLLQLLVAGTAGLVTAYGAMTALRVPELSDTVGRVAARFRRG
jgi:putative peptidoglycan lipid II flippase